MKILKLNEMHSKVLVDNSENYVSSENYSFYYDMYLYLSYVYNNLCKLNGNPVLIKDLILTGENPYTHDTIGNMFSIGHITGLAVEEALVTCISTYINGYVEGEDDDYADIIDTIGRQGFDISKEIYLSFGKDNMPKRNFTINYKGHIYSVQIKAVQSKNEGIREMNAAIRNNVDLGIVVVYNMENSDVVIDSIQLYVPDIDGTYDYISTKRIGNKKLSLDRSKSFITIGA